MNTRHQKAMVPREAITLTTYAQLDLYLCKFSLGELGLVLLIGRHGTGKSESVKRALRVTVPDRSSAAAGLQTLYVEGHMQTFGLYRHLWEHRDLPVVLDDLDKLYADSDCVRLLKPLCNTETARRVSWLTNLTIKSPDVPASFITRSRIILVANEWRSINANVRALEDRAIILHFDPSNEEVHRKVGEWFEDRQVYAFIADVMPSIPAISMRHYCKGAQLRGAGFADWRSSLLRMLIPDARLACLVALQLDSTLLTERERVERFIKLTGQSRATYFRSKARAVRLAEHETQR